MNATQAPSWITKPHSKPQAQAPLSSSTSSVTSGSSSNSELIHTSENSTPTKAQPEKRTYVRRQYQKGQADQPDEFKVEDYKPAAVFQITRLNYTEARFMRQQCLTQQMCATKQSPTKEPRGKQGQLKNAASINEFLENESDGASSQDNKRTPSELRGRGRPPKQPDSTYDVIGGTSTEAMKYHVVRFIRTGDYDGIKHLLMPIENSKNEPLTRFQLEVHINKCLYETFRLFKLDATPRHQERQATLESKGQSEYSQVLVEHMIERYQQWKTCREQGKPFPKLVAPLNLIKARRKPRKNASKNPRRPKHNITKNGFSYKKNLEMSSAPIRRVHKDQITDEQIAHNSKRLMVQMSSFDRQEAQPIEIAAFAEKISTKGQQMGRRYREETSSDEANECGGREQDSADYDFLDSDGN